MKDIRDAPQCMIGTKPISMLDSLSLLGISCQPIKKIGGVGIDL